MPFGNQPGAGGEVLPTRPGPGSARVPMGITDPNYGVGQPGALRIAPLPTLPPNTLPVFGRLALPAAAEDEGPPQGLTLDQAIERLVRANLDLLSRSFEVPQAEADVLTASMRANPLLYADSQLVPYGNFSRARPGGPTQYDLNITHPLDVSHKRQARIEVATKAKQVLQAQLQNEVRLQIDNLYTAYVNLLAARLTRVYAQASVVNFRRMLEVTRTMKAGGVRTAVDIGRIQMQADAAELLLADAEGNLRSARRTLALLLNIPLTQFETLELRGGIKDRAATPPDVPALTRMALSCRPDLVAYRLGVGRASADVTLAKRNRYQDVYLLFQPYTFQNNAPYGTKSGTSWAMGVTVPLPLYNRNQGFIRRAELNVTQTQIELNALERQIIGEVEAAAQEYALTRAYIERFERGLVPIAQRMVNNTEVLFRGGERDVVDYLNAQRDANDLARQYIDTLVRHRRSMLRLNTVVGQRLLP
jgi:cobalt-zinc-cadmium efflux system outer membrane protein